MVNDIISDMLTRIRNANRVKHYITEIPYTRLTEDIAIILQSNGFISHYVKKEKESTFLLYLKYSGKDRKPVITEITRVSKPGMRVYTKSKNLPIILDNLGIAILSTSQGLMTNIEARKQKIGGEILCYVS